MLTILKVGPYRFFFYSADGIEPPHIHAERENKIAKFWLTPVRLQSSGRFSRKEITRIQSLIQEHQNEILEKWNEYFSS